MFCKFKVAQRLQLNSIKPQFWPLRPFRGPHYFTASKSHVCSPILDMYHKSKVTQRPRLYLISTSSLASKAISRSPLFYSVKVIEGGRFQLCFINSKLLSDHDLINYNLKSGLRGRFEVAAIFRPQKVI